MKKIIFVLAVLVPVECFAGSSTTGGVILKEEIGARPRGMGGAFTALADDMTSLHWNPAGLTSATDIEVSAMFLSGLASSNYEFIGGSIPTDVIFNSKSWYGKHSHSSSSEGIFGTSNTRVKRKERDEDTSVFALSLVALQSGTMDVYQLDGTYAGSVRAEDDFLVTLGYACPVYKGLSLGVAGKVITSRIAEAASAVAYAGDLGCRWQVDFSDSIRTRAIDGLYLNVGAALQNLGTKIKYSSSGEGDKLPLAIKGGVAGTMFFKPSVGSLSLAVDVNKAQDTKLRENIGTEFWYQQAYAARLGYRFGYDLDGFTTGIGARIYMFQLDYAFGLMSSINTLHQVSLTAYF